MSNPTPDLVEKRNGKLLYRAISGGSNDCVAQLLSSGVDPNSAHNGLPPLHACVQFHQLQIAKTLINAGSDVNSKDTAGRTALFLAIESQDLQFFNLIISSRGDVNTSDNGGFTPLHISTESPIEEIYMKSLLKNGAYVDAKTQEGITPLHYAISRKSLEKVNLLLKFKPNVNMIEYCNIFNGTLDRNCHLRMIVDVLLTYGFSVNEEKVRDKMFMCRAVASNQYSLVEHLLRKGADPNSKYHGCSPLDLACRFGYQEIFKLLLHYGADSRNSIVAIDYAVMYNHHEIVLELLNKGALKRPSLFFYALMHNSTEVLESLLKYNLPRFNVNSSFGETTLAHQAALMNNPKAVKLLWRFGADFNILIGGFSPMHNACLERASQAILAMLNIGADVNLTDIEGKTPADILYRSDIKLAKLIKRHIIMLYAAGMFVSERNLSFMREGQDEEFLSDVSAEVELLKNTLIADSGISFYKLLKCSEAEMANYLNNQDIHSCLKSYDYKDKFKHFFHLLISKFLEGSRRKTFIDSFKEHIVAKIDFLNNIPSTCLHYILSLLSTEDIGIMVGHVQQRMNISESAIYYKRHFIIQKGTNDFILV